MYNIVSGHEVCGQLSHPLSGVWTMKTVLLLAILAMATITGCAREEAHRLPMSYQIFAGENLFTATAQLCGSTAPDEQGRGRWRRWLKSDERIARAEVRQHPTLGTIVVIQPGSYIVPRNLCANEASFPWLLVLAVCCVFALIYILGRATSVHNKPEELGPSVALAKTDGFAPPARIL